MLKLAHEKLVQLHLAMASLGIAFFLVFFALDGHAQFANFSLWHSKKPILNYTTSSQSVLAELCSGAVTVQTKSYLNVVTNVTADLTVALSGPAGMTFYADDSCTKPINTLTIANGTSSANFYYLSTTVGSPTITASATNYISALQAQTISTNGFIWTGAGGNTSWSTAGNWSGGVAPGASNVATFNGSCASNCSPDITANVSVRGVRINAPYAGTITQTSNYTLTTSFVGWVQNSGTFVGSNSAGAIKFQIRFVLTGGSFTATNGNFTVERNSSYDYMTYTVAAGATFSANSGSLILDSACGFYDVKLGTPTYNNVSLQNSSGCATYRFLDSSVNVAGNMDIVGSAYSPSLNGATFNISGNLTTSGTTDWAGTTIFKMTGNASGQTITSVGSRTIPNLVIDAGTNPITLVGVVKIYFNYTWVSSGTFTTTGSTLYMAGGCSNAKVITPGTVIYNNVTFDSQCDTFSLASGTMKVSGDLRFNAVGYNGAINSGTFEVSGNVYTTGGVRWQGNAVVKLVGNASGQTITSTNTGAVPNLTLETGTNAVTFNGSVMVGSYIVNSVGTLTMTGMSLRILGPTLTVGSEIYGDITLGGTCVSINLTGTFNVSGTLTFNDGGCGNGISGGAIVAKGNIDNEGWGGGTTNISLLGTASQTLSGAGFRWPGTSVTVNNAAGIVLAADVSSHWSTFAWNVVSGNIDMAGHALFISALTLNSNTITRNGGTLTVNGTNVGAGTVSAFGGTINP